MNQTPDTDATQPESAHAQPTFDVLPLSDEVRRALADVGYEHPTPVQIAVWEPATRGRDAVVQARTGTGKTASFGLPIVDQLVKKSLQEPQALVLCPTRELAVQVSGEVERLGKYREIRTLSIYGGASMERQVEGIQAGAQVIVGTPGRVLDHIRRGTLPVSAIRLLVLDEADEMLSMGFEKELTAILENLPPSRQTLLFSATVPPDIERIAKNRLKDPEFVTLSGDHIGALSIEHFIYLVASDKVGTLVRIIETENPESAVVFCNTRDETERVATALSQRGYDADWLNGDLPQSEREDVMRRTREGKLRFLVATDVAARGIDISHLTHVINYDFPFDAESYVHRTGRTGRAGRTGTAISLITPQDSGGLYLLRLVYKIRPVERQIPTTVELKTRAEADLVAMLAEAFLSKGVHEDDRALARRLLSHDQAEGIIAGLLRDHLGARPKAQEEASQQRRATVRRGSLKRRTEPPAVERAVAPSPVAPSEAAEVSPEGEAGAERAPREGRGPRRDDRFGRGEPRRDDRGPRRDDRFGRGEPRRDDRGPRRDDRFGRGEPRSAGPVTAEQALPPAAAPAATPAGPVNEPIAPAKPSEPSVGDAAPRDAAPRDAAPREGRREDGRRSRERRSTAGREGAPREVAHRDLAQWTPPEEEGDDEPLIPSRPAGHAPHERRHAEGHEAPRRHEVHPHEPSAIATLSGDDVPYAELFVGVGRRDGARAQDLLRVLVETAGLDKDHIRRIRVRDRHAFVGVRKEDAAVAIAKLHGTAIAGKSEVTVELARERSGAEEPPTQVEAPAEG